MSWDNRLQGMPKALIGGAAMYIIEEIEDACPGVIENNLEEVCEIFTEVIKRHKREASAALAAKNLAFVHNLQKLAAVQEEREKRQFGNAPIAARDQHQSHDGALIVERAKFGFEHE